MSTTRLIFVAGIGQLCILVASATVPFLLNWRIELHCLPRLHRQMYWIYGGYVVISIVAFALLSIFNAAEIGSGTGLARGFCAYVAVFWGVRTALQAVLDVNEQLRKWWLKIGYFALTLMFVALTVIYAWGALNQAST